MANKFSVFDCSVISLTKIQNRAGNITYVENDHHIPFQVRRLYYLYDVPGGESRAGHAHRELESIIVAVSGSFDVLIDDGSVKRTINLNRPYFALHVKQGIWRELHNFSSGAVCLVLASELYNEEDYIRSYNDFLNYRNVND